MDRKLWHDAYRVDKGGAQRKERVLQSIAMLKSMGGI